jgi:chemotaxis signal transduction protein
MNRQTLASAAEAVMNPTRNAAASDWLDPVEALTRFSPAERVALDGASEPVQADVRYAIRVGNIGLLIGARVPSEFILPVPVSRVPNTPDWFAGLINLRGALLPVFDLESMVVSDQDAAQTNVANGRLLFLVLGRGDRAAALKIHGFPQPLHGLKPLDEMPSIHAPLDECVSSALVENDSVWFELDHVRLFEAFSARLAKPGNASGQ